MELGIFTEPGSEKRILLDAVNNCIGLDEIHVGTAMTMGRSFAPS